MRKIMEEKEIIREISLPLYLSKGWLKLIGVLTIIYGVICALTIFGLIIACLPIWMGVLLFKTGSEIEIAKLEGDKQHLLNSMWKLKTYFTICGVLALIGLIALGIGLIVAGGTIGGLFSLLV